MASIYEAPLHFRQMIAGGYICIYSPCYASACKSIACRHIRAKCPNKSKISGVIEQRLWRLRFHSARPHRKVNNVFASLSVPLRRAVARVLVAAQTLSPGTITAPVMVIGILTVVSLSELLSKS
jgi:hypothetical protein